MGEVALGEFGERRQIAFYGKPDPSSIVPAKAQSEDPWFERSQTKAFHVGFFAFEEGWNPLGEDPVATAMDDREIRGRSFSKKLLLDRSIYVGGIGVGKPGTLVGLHRKVG